MCFAVVIYSRFSVATKFYIPLWNSRIQVHKTRFTSLMKPNSFINSILRHTSTYNEWESYIKFDDGLVALDGTEYRAYNAYRLTYSGSVPILIEIVAITYWYFV